MRVQITEDMWVDVDLSPAQREALGRGESVTVNLFPDLDDAWDLGEISAKNEELLDYAGAGKYGPPFDVGDYQQTKVEVRRHPDGPRVHVAPAGTGPLEFGTNPNVDPKRLAEEMRKYTQERYSYPPRAVDLNVTPEFDPVNHPSHYTEGRSIEPIDAIEDWDLDFNSGQVVKYLSRLGRKGDALEDARKAEFYLKRLISRLEAEE